MSLKRYIFLLIAFIILTLTAVQLSFVSYVQDQVNQEIQQTSKALSAQIIEFAQESLEQAPMNDETAKKLMANASLNQFYNIKIIQPERKIIKINDYYSLEVDNGKPVIELTPHFDQVIENQDLKMLLGAIDIVQNDDHESFSLIKQTKDSLEQKTFEFQQQNAATNTYFNNLFILTFAMASFGLIAAYFMAKHISEPLKQLKQGFNQLEQGDFNVSLQEQGIAETRKTLTQFNAMTQRLAQLDEQSKHYAAVQHMSDIGEMTRGLAHALRNPINTIGLSIEQMAEPTVNDSQRTKIAQAAREKITAMDNTIKSLLTLAADESLIPVAFNIFQVIQDVTLEVAATSRHKITIASKKSLPFIGHESEIRSIIHSIVVNAIEASCDCTPVKIKAELIENKLIITIEDHGTGIDDLVKDKLFKPHITTKPEGAGMGLYIAKRLCQLHYHGDITLVDNQPHGCIATITLISLTIADEL
ncbi:sensor histidine kinase [Psychrobium sp. nBUS_13]|uniref:sensor histidine kinase n=1 Tax=Psychrobium sp. nBUS_13 TaxID=3395319 RepID=UPI003EB8E8FB